MPEYFSKSIDNLIAKKDNYILSSEANFLDGFNNIEKAIFDAVRKKTFELNSKDGKILFDDTNTDIVSGLNKTIRDAIQGSSYPDNVKTYLRDFDKIKEYNLDATSKINDLDPGKLADLVNPIQKSVVKQTLDGLAGSGIDTNFSDPLRTGIYKNIVAGSTFSDLENYLRGYILSDETKLGQFKRYVTQISRDALNQFDGQVNSAIATEYGLDAYRYVGSLIEDSRPQCVRWVSKGVLLLSELPTEIAWATSSGSGMISATTPETFAIYRGGYNCRHSAIPFKLTKSQREELGLEDPKKANAKEAKLEENLNKKGILPLTEAEKDLNLTYGKSKLIPPGLEKVVSDLKIPDQVFELSDDGKYKLPVPVARKGTKTYENEKNSFFYTPSSKEVTLGLEGSRFAKSDKFQKFVIVHEYGHRTHHERGIFYGSGSTAKSDPVHLKKFEESVSLLNDRIKKEKLGKTDFEWKAVYLRNKGKFEGINDKDLAELVADYTDTIEALSKGKFGYGHGKKYFTEFGGYKRQREWFAHASENYWIGNPIFKAEFPELYEQMNDYYREFVIKPNLGSFLKK
jgi:hypothetical protein